MADQTTPNLNLIKPEIGASRNTWGQKLWDDLDILDTVIAQAQADINAEEAARLAADNLESSVRAAADTSEGLIRAAADTAEAAARVAGDAAEAAARVAGDAAEAAARADLFEEAVLSAQSGTSALSFADIPGLFLSLAAGTWAFEIVFQYFQIPQTGVFVGVNGPAATEVSWLGQFGTGPATVVGRSANAYNQNLGTPIVPDSSEHAGVMRGLVILTTPGIFTLRGHVTSGQFFITAGSYIRARRLA